MIGWLIALLALFLFCGVMPFAKSGSMVPEGLPPDPQDVAGPDGDDGDMDNTDGDDGSEPEPEPEPEPDLYAEEFEELQDVDLDDPKPEPAPLVPAAPVVPVYQPLPIPAAPVAAQPEVDWDEPVTRETLQTVLDAREKAHEKKFSDFQQRMARDQETRRAKDDMVGKVNSEFSRYQVTKDKGGINRDGAERRVYTALSKLVNASEAEFDAAIKREVRRIARQIHIESGRTLSQKRGIREEGGEPDPVQVAPHQREAARSPDGHETAAQASSRREKRMMELST